MKKSILSTCVYFGCMVLYVHAQQNLVDEKPIATIGKAAITSREFLSRYELTPAFHRSSRGKIEENKIDFLFSLIAEKLLAQQAMEQGIQSDSVYRTELSEVERLLARDELYHQEVRQKVSLSEEEVQQALAKEQTELKIYFLYTPTLKNAERLKSYFQKGIPLESVYLIQDTALAYEGPDSAIARWGNGDERIESVLYSLSLNQTSEPIKLDDGYYIAKVMGKSITFYGGEREQKTARERVEGILRKRKELKRMFEYIASALKNTNTTINAKLLKEIVDILNVHAQVEKAKNDTAKFMLSDDIVQAMRRELKDEFTKSFITFSKYSWNGETTVNKILTDGFVVDHPSLKNIRAAFDQRLRDIIDQEHLTQIALQKQLQHSESVQKELRMWRDAFLAQTLVNTLRDTLTISSHDVALERTRISKDSLQNPETAEIISSLKDQRQKYILDRYLGVLANKFNVSVDSKALSNLEVTRTPSLVYRYLGFGGRMFAVPFVEPNVQWVNFWKSGNIVLP